MVHGSRFCFSLLVVQDTAPFMIQSSCVSQSSPRSFCFGIGVLYSVIAYIE